MSRDDAPVPDADDAADRDAVAPLAEFAAAWRELDAPDATAALAAPDAATQATVDWLRAAWQASAPATPTGLPWSMRTRLALRRVAPWSALVAAAAAVVILLTQLAEPARVPPTPSAPLENVAIGPVPEPIASVPTAPAEIRPVIHADRMEMRSGNVRLILFTPAAPPRAADASPENSR